MNAPSHLLLACVLLGCAPDAKPRPWAYVCGYSDDSSACTDGSNLGGAAHDLQLQSARTYTCPITASSMRFTFTLVNAGELPLEFEVREHPESATRDDEDIFSIPAPGDTFACPPGVTFERPEVVAGPREGTLPPLGEVDITLGCRSDVCDQLPSMEYMFEVVTNEPEDRRTLGVRMLADVRRCHCQGCGEGGRLRYCNVLP